MRRLAIVRRPGSEIAARRADGILLEVREPGEPGPNVPADLEAEEKLRARLARTVHRIETFWLKVARARRTSGPA